MRWSASNKPLTGESPTHEAIAHGSAFGCAMSLNILRVRDLGIRSINHYYLIEVQWEPDPTDTDPGYCGTRAAKGRVENEHTYIAFHSLQMAESLTAT